MQSSNSAVHNGIWNATSNIFTMLAGFASSILIVRSLAPESYGTYSYFVWLASILSAVGSIGFPSALNKFVSELRGQGRYGTALKLIRRASWLMLLLNLVVSTTVVLLALNNANPTRTFMLIIAAVPLINVFVAIPTATLMGFERFRPLAIATSSAGLIQLGLVVLSFTQGWGIVGYLVAVLSINVLLAVFLGILLLRDTPRAGEVTSEPVTAFRSDVFRPFLAFVVPATLYHTVLNSLLWHRPEVFFLERLSTIEQVGFYNLAFTIFNILVILGWALVNGFYPAISRNFGAGDWAAVRGHINQGLLLGFVYAVPLAFGAVATLEVLITTLYGTKMLPSLPIANVLMLGLIPGVAAGLLGITLNALHRPWLMVGFSSIVAVIKMVMIAALIPRFGALGAAWSATVAAVIALLLEYLVLHRLFTIRLPWRSFGGILIIGGLSTFLIPFGITRLIPGLGGLILAVVVSASIYLLALWRFGYLEKLDLVMTRTDPTRLRILHILGDRTLTPDPYTSGASGVVRAVLEIAQEQASEGHEVWVAAVGSNTFKARWQGVTLVSLPRMPWANLRLGRRNLDLRSHLRYLLLTLAHPFDVIHGHFHNYLRFLRARVRVAHFHGDPFFKGADHEELAFKDTDFSLVGRTTDIQIGISRYVSAQLELGFNSQGNIRTVSNGVNTESFDPAVTSAARQRWRKAWDVKDEDVVFLFAGLLAEVKGVHLLAEAFASLYPQLPHIHLAIAGSDDLWHMDTGEDSQGSYTERVKQTLEPARERVHLLGKRAAAEMPGIYAASDVLVVPSVWPEGFGLVAVEGLASGLPVIASNTGGLPESVTIRNGRLFDKNDVEKLTDLMRQIATDSELRASLAAAARPSVLPKSWKRVAHQLTDIYQETLATKVPHIGLPVKDEHANSRPLVT